MAQAKQDAQEQSLPATEESVTVQQKKENAKRLKQ